MKKAERLAKATARETCRQQAAREEAAMQFFLLECRANMPADVWAKESEEAARSAGRTFHIVEWMVSALAATQMPIPPRLRQALDALLDTLGMERGNLKWDALRELNYGPYWKSHYGY